MHYLSLENFFFLYSELVAVLVMALKEYLVKGKTDDILAYDEH